MVDSEDTECCRRRERGRGGSREGPDTKETEPSETDPGVKSGEMIKYPCSRKGNVAGYAL